MLPASASPVALPSATVACATAPSHFDADSDEPLVPQPIATAASAAATAAISHVALMIPFMLEALSCRRPARRTRVDHRGGWR